MIKKTKEESMDKNEVLQSQENQTKNVMQEIKEEYTKTVDFLEEHTGIQLNIAEELKDEMKNKDFDANIEELKALKEEIAGLKAEIKRLNEMENIGLSSLIVRDIKTVGNTLINLQEKAVGSIKHLYDNMKHQLSYNLTKAQEKFVQMKIGIVKGLVNSMQDFIKDQQKKLDSCLELGKDSLNKEEKPIEKKEQNERKKEGQKEQTEKKPSVLKKLKENQQKIKKEEKVRDVKAPKKDKGMEI